MFIVIMRTEAPVARNKYPEEAVEKILDVAERVEKGWSQKSPTAVTASLETRPTMDGEPER